MIKKISILLFLCLSCVSLSAQDKSEKVNETSVFDNWYIQLGLDMSLQNPYGHNFADVFPNGKSFGVDIALGKWFTSSLGIRGKVNWENGIKLFENHHADWLAPFYERGVNMNKGGYLSVTGDIQFDLHNLFLGYDDTRRWHLQVFPSAGIVYNFGVEKGSPLLGFGIGNTYRLNNHYTLYGDISYNMVSSGFVGVEKSTGTGSNNNGYLNMTVGLQMNLGKEKETPWLHRDEKSTFWQNWYLQGGLDMTLVNPYGANFAEVFPKGKTFGMVLAAGKWFSPEIGLRLRFKMDNNILKNGHFEWIGPLDNDGHSTNYSDGGFVVFCGDMPLNLNNIFLGYDPERKWNVILFPRAGLVTNRATNSGSPLVGAGFGGTYRISEKWSLYGDVAYQVSTSEFFEANSSTGMSVSKGSNGFFDFFIGVQYDLGKKKCTDFTH